MGGQAAGRLLGALTAATCFAFCADTACGLTDEDLFRGFQFNFVEAGARARGIGGAFVALADDASAIEANPAGLRAVRTPHLYLEYSSIHNDTTRIESTRGSLKVNPVTGERELPFLVLSSAHEPDTTQVPALVGLAWPFTVGGDDLRLTVAAARQVTYSRDLSLPSTGGSTQARFSFDSFPNTVKGSRVEAYSVAAAVSGDLSAEIVNWSTSASVEVHPDFSVGVTLTYATLDLQAATLVRIADPLQILVDVSHPRLPAQPSIDVYRTLADGTDEEFTYAIGVHWHPGTAFAGGLSPWQFGASFRKGATFGVEESTFLNGEPDRTLENRIAVPDRYAVGASYRLRDRWTFSGELERVEFSDLVGDFEAGVGYLTGPHIASGAFTTRPGRSIRFEVDDGIIYRLGLEYQLPLAGGHDRALAFRGGWFRVPEVQIEMTRFNSADPDVNRTYREAFPEGDPESHYTLGVGLTWGGSTFQAAFETSDVGDRLLATYIFEWRGQ